MPYGFTSVGHRCVKGRIMVHFRDLVEAHWRRKIDADDQWRYGSGFRAKQAPARRRKPTTRPTYTVHRYNATKPPLVVSRFRKPKPGMRFTGGLSVAGKVRRKRVGGPKPDMGLFDKIDKFRQAKQG